MRSASRIMGARARYDVAPKLHARKATDSAPKQRIRLVRSFVWIDRVLSMITMTSLIALSRGNHGKHHDSQS
jgi:hypothetical protein